MLKTPNRLLYGRQLHFNNYNNSVKMECLMLTNVQLETVSNHFWNIWGSKYIPSFLEYQKLYKRQNQVIPSVGDIDKESRHKCLLEGIYDVITVKDGAIRGAKLFAGKTEKKQLNVQ